MTLMTAAVPSHFELCFHFFLKQSPHNLTAFVLSSCNFSGLHELVLHNGCCSIRRAPTISTFLPHIQLTSIPLPDCDTVPSETFASAWIQALNTVYLSCCNLMYPPQNMAPIASKKYRAQATTAGGAGLPLRSPTPALQGNSHRNT